MKEEVGWGGGGRCKAVAPVHLSEQMLTPPSSVIDGASDQASAQFEIVALSCATPSTISTVQCRTELYLPDDQVSKAPCSLCSSGLALKPMSLWPEKQTLHQNRYITGVDGPPLGRMAVNARGVDLPPYVHHVGHGGLRAA